jgi:TetR/AcrR family transcriptional regulator
MVLRTALALVSGHPTASRILDVALDHFSRLGFERVTMGGIAQEAGVAPASLHYHFLDKADLWRKAMLQLRAVLEQEERLLEAAAREADPLARLRMAMRLFLRLSWEQPALGRIVMLEGMAGGERLAWLDENLIGPRNRALVKLVAQAIDAGQLKPFPPALIVVTLQTAASGIINLAPLMRVNFGIDARSRAAREAHERMIIDAILGGLTVQPQPGAGGTA